MSRIPPTGNSAAPKNQDNFAEEGEDKKLVSDSKKRNYGTFDPHSVSANALKSKIGPSNPSDSKEVPLQSRKVETGHPKTKELQSKAAGQADDIKEGKLNKSDQDKINEMYWNSQS